jgi:predicted peptidase
MRRAAFWAGLLLGSLLLAGCGGESGTPQDTSGTSGGVSLPVDSGGTQTAVSHLSTTAPYGHYLYLPGGYRADGPEYPLLVFLHGAGEKGDSSTNPATLDKVLVHGPPRLIREGHWAPSLPMIVASPQCHDGGWNATKLHDFITYLLATYRIDPSRIYMTGLSMGGYGTFAYCTAKGADAYVAAVVPICGGGSTGQAGNMAQIPTWAFHGDADSTVSVTNSINMIAAINTAHPTIPARLTIYPGVGHDSWTRTYNGSGMGTERADYDPFTEDVFEWMLRYQRL